MLIEIAHAADAVSKVIKAMEDAIEFLDDPRGIAMVVYNYTDKEMDLHKHRFTEGGWGEPPDGRIRPGKASVFSVKSNFIFTGAAGWITYRIMDTNPREAVRVNFNNPYIGFNSGSARALVDKYDPVSRSFPNSRNYAMKHYIGSGYISKNEYELRDK